MDQLTSNFTQKNARRLLELAGVSVLLSGYIAMLRIVVLASLVLLVVLSPPGWATQATQQTNAIPKGQIVEKLECLNDSSQSYALYLPANYTPDRKWPILYALDPGARGKTPVERFKEAAEKLGWFVAGWNNSRNGPWSRAADAWSAMTKDTLQRFSIDDDRVYATGLSGGARMALQFAQLCQDCLAGVIACGAGLPRGLVLSTAMHFLFCGTTGTYDFNFSELRGLDDPLTKAGIIHRIDVFDGRHEWPPIAVATAAIEWMELHAMKSGKRPRDDAFIDATWQQSVKQAGTLEESKKYYEAYQIYLDLSESFKDLRDVNEVQKKASQLSNSREVKDAMREEQQQIRKQREIEAQLQPLIGALPRNGDDGSGREDTRSSVIASADEEAMNRQNRLQALLSQLRKQSNASEDSSARRVARRVLDGAFVALFEQGSSFLQTEKHYREAITTFKLATEVNPDRPGPFFYLAWAYAASGDKKKSVQALSTAIDKGFSDLTAISNNKAFDPIRNDPQYQQIVGKLKK